MEMPAAAKTYYSRVFMEQFLAACGSEPLEATLQTVINPVIDDLVRNHGQEAGIQFREFWLANGGTYNG